MTKRKILENSCGCDSGVQYDACCGRYHFGPEYLQAPNAEVLMRSRYCAYVRGLDAYLLDTWHPSTRPADLKSFDEKLRWLGLEVRRHVVISDTEAEVEFVARSKREGRAYRLHETSRFVAERGRWYYLDGKIH